MNCQSCMRPLFKHDDEHVACKGGHIWRVSVLPDENPAGRELRPAVRLVKQRQIPAWLPGAVLGGVALVIQVVSLLI